MFCLALVVVRILFCLALVFPMGVYSVSYVYRQKEVHCTVKTFILAHFPLLYCFCSHKLTFLLSFSLKYKNQYQQPTKRCLVSLSYFEVKCPKISYFMEMTLFIIETCNFNKSFLKIQLCHALFFFFLWKDIDKLSYCGHVIFEFKMRFHWDAFSTVTCVTEIIYFKIMFY